MVDPSWKASLVQLSPQQRADAARIATELGSTGLVLPGSLSERRLTCTHPGCHCHGSPPQLHGPYWYLTRKVAGKTVTKMLRPEQVEEYKVLIENGRRLRHLVREFEALGLSILEDDPRSPRRRQAKGPVDEPRSSAR